LSFNLRYFWEVPWDTGITPPEVVEFVTSSTPRKALDLGAGTGTNIIYLAKAGWESVGIEYALGAVVASKKKIYRAGVNTKIYFHDLTNLDFLSPDFDLVLDIGCFHSLDPIERQQYWKNVNRLLKPGGIFLLYGFLIEMTKSQIGISEEEIGQFSHMMDLLSAKRGAERGLRDSIWQKFRKKEEIANY
jgi:SAM-dependent methyltransferase